ncbi:RNA ligase family protein [Streptomyces sp. CA-288835]|uniref:RNA ligase family protein n=1 Tax=Streptomyces sp. CA-288835 TaxID=3240069 RepID=UPI003D8F487A
MTEIQFQKWPKTARIFRDCVITEKLDGTNAAIGIVPGTDETALQNLGNHVKVGDRHYCVYAQSRNHIITPKADSFGFAGWVYKNAAGLVELLGEGLHFGEWWGAGIQRRYGQAGKTFSLFNTGKWWGLSATLGDADLSVVPTVYEGPFSTMAVGLAMAKLKRVGSFAAPGFMDPEGVCIYHKANGTVFKATFEHDQTGKDAK